MKQSWKRNSLMYIIILLAAVVLFSFLMPGMQKPKEIPLSQVIAMSQNGEIAEIEIDEETLQEIAGRTQARYFRATDVESLNLVYSEIDQLERSTIEVKQYTRYRELYGFFLIPALILGIVYDSLNRSVFRRIHR